MPNTNTIRCNLGPITRLHLFEGELIHWVGKAKNVWPIVRRLPTGTKMVPSRSRILGETIYRIYSNPYRHYIFLESPFVVQILPFFCFRITNKLITQSWRQMQRILSLSEHEALELQNSNTESLDGLAFFPINSWPRVIRTLFHKSEIGDTDTFKFILFALETTYSRFTPEFSFH